jgi:hypothetical protein
MREDVECEDTKYHATGGGVVAAPQGLGPCERTSSDEAEDIVFQAGISDNDTDIDE